jgi:putative membrane protein
VKINTALGFVFIGTVLSLPGVVLAQAPDQPFAQEAASGGMAEVKLGQLAQANGSSDTVKQFGKRMTIDHSKAGDELKDAASRDNITVSPRINKTDQATYDRLSKLSGAEFDKAYADQMVQDHKKDIASFRKESQTGLNPDVKQFASQTLPTLEDHLKMAEAMQKRVSGTDQSASGMATSR